MFPSSARLFKDIPCPSLKSGSSCEFLNCIFSHEAVKVKPKRTVVSKKRSKSASSDDDLEIIGRPAQRVQRPEAVEKTQSSISKPVIDIKENLPKVAPDVDRSSKAHTPKIPSPQVPPTTDVILLTPTPVDFSPALFSQRASMIKVIHQALVDAGGCATPKRAAIEFEHKIALESSKVSYPMNIRKLVKNIRQGMYNNVEEKKRSEEEQTKQRYRAELENLIIPRDALQARRYVTDVVLPEEIDMSAEISCARCGSMFKIGRKDPIVCRFHPLRREYDPVKKKRSDIFPCCSQPLGESQGCCTAGRHVFKVDEPKKLASVVPFAKTPNNPGRLFAAGIDCEMGYTSYGMELIRVTVVDWDTEKVVLDRAVRPYGEVLDFNTRFSGISTLENGIVGTDGKHYPTVSFKETRELLFKHISAETILIGHGLENDLNALRLVHLRVVDTAIRYPMFKPPRTYSLKQLAFQYLGKTIQLGQHDSSEDAIVAIKIVKENIKRKMTRVEIVST